MLGNHDRPRVASRVGRSRQGRRHAAADAARHADLYYGDEIGLPQATLPADRSRTPAAAPTGPPTRPRPCRTPMPWDAGAFAGFSSATPWLPLAEDFAVNNVGCQRANSASLFNLYRRLIALRRSRLALSRGAYRPLEAIGDILAYIREADGDRVLVGLNFGDGQAALTVPSPGTVLLSSNADREGQVAVHSLALRPHEGVIVALSPEAAWAGRGELARSPDFPALSP